MLLPASQQAGARQDDDAPSAITCPDWQKQNKAIGQQASAKAERLQPASAGSAKNRYEDHITLGDPARSALAAQVSA